MRVYADTSVFGGCFDDEFRTASQVFFDQAKAGILSLQTSALVESELEAAPEDVQQLFEEMLPFAEFIEVSEAALDLQDAYLAEAVLSSKWASDALHVALASVAGSDVIVSWNFRHIVHRDKIVRYNAVNARRGYGEIGIFSPSQVVQYEEDV